MRFHLSLLATAILAGCGGGSGFNSNANDSNNNTNNNPSVSVQSTSQAERELSRVLTTTTVDTTDIILSKNIESELDADETKDVLKFAALHLHLNGQYLPIGGRVQQFLSNDLNIDLSIPHIDRILGSLATETFVDGEYETQIDTVPLVDTSLLTNAQKIRLGNLISDRYINSDAMSSLVETTEKAFELNQSMHILDLIQGDVTYAENMEAASKNEFLSLLPIRSDLGNSPNGVNFDSVNNNPTVPDVISEEPDVDSDSNNEPTVPDVISEEPDANVGDNDFDAGFDADFDAGFDKDVDGNNTASPDTGNQGLIFNVLNTVLDEEDAAIGSFIGNGSVAAFNFGSDIVSDIYNTITSDTVTSVFNDIYQEAILRSIVDSATDALGTLDIPTFLNDINGPDSSLLEIDPSAFNVVPTRME